MKFAMALCLCCAVPAWATRPFVTDDARLTTAGSCQTGLRYSIVPELLQVDTTVDAQHDGGRGGRCLSFGLRWTPARLLSQP
jgi:hypothetical protein